MDEIPEDYLRSRFGDAPLSMSSVNEEWDAIPDELKQRAMKHLWAYVKMMTQEHAIQLLCHTVMDMQKRIEKLEKKIPQNS